MEFTITVGINYYLHKNEALSQHVFGESILHKSSFEIDWMFEPYSKILPYRLLTSAQDQALSIIKNLKSPSGDEHIFWSENTYCGEGYWDNYTYFPRDYELTEVYYYIHVGFKKCLWIKLSWDAFQASRDGFVFKGGNR